MTTATVSITGAGDEYGYAGELVLATGSHEFPQRGEARVVRLPLRGISGYEHGSLGIVNLPMPYRALAVVDDDACWLRVRGEGQWGMVRWDADGQWRAYDGHWDYLGIRDSLESAVELVAAGG